MSDHTVPVVNIYGDRDFYEYSDEIEETSEEEEVRVTFVLSRAVAAALIEALQQTHRHVTVPDEDWTSASTMSEE